MKIKFEWEEIFSSPDGRNFTYRAKVFGGWIISSYTYATTPAESMVFIPDPNHEWEIEND